jgi:uncharacterized protein YndB with AHSA1/START domain
MVKRLALSTLAVLVAAVAALLGLALSKPDTYHVKREIEIAAPASAVWSQLQDFRRWTKWSPWEAQDSGVKRSYAGPASGAGARYAWEGKNIGSGEMTMTESTPPEKLVIRLEFIKPLAETNQLRFELTPLPAAEATKVQWSMSGPTRFAAKFLSVFVRTDAIIGRDLETGLKRLKALCEAAAK